MKMIKSKRFEGVYHYKKQNGDVSFYITYKDTTNKTITKKIGDKSVGITEQYCFQIRNETILKLQSNELPPKVALQKKYKVITLDNVADYYFKEKKTKSLHKYLGKYNLRIKNTLGRKDIGALDKTDMLKFRENLLDDNLSNQTVNCYIDIVSAIVNYAILNDIYKGKNPTKLISKLKVDNKRERILSVNEIEDLLEAVSDDWLANLFVRLSLSTAARKSTILRIKKCDVSLDNGTMVLKDVKTNSTYVGFINDDELKQLLKNRMDMIGNNDLLISEFNIKDMDRYLSRQLSTIFFDLFNYELDENDSNYRKIKVVTHTLRHTVLSHLAMNGESPYVIRQISNHKSLSMVDRYVKLNPTLGKNPIENLWKTTPSK